jgi:hypothetical protein
MKVNAIKDLVENHDLVTLQLLQHELENEQPLSQEVPGDDDGEKLTHLLGAIWVKEQMFEKGTDARTEIRNFAARVRDSIS